MDHNMLHLQIGIHFFLKRWIIVKNYFPKIIGQTTGFVAKCNTNNGTEEKCNASSALPNETICFFDYNTSHIQ